LSADPFAALDAAIAAADAAERPALVVQLAGRLAALGAGMVQSPTPQAGPSPERNLDVAEAAARLGMSEAWLYRHGAELPFAVRLGRRLLFSERGLDAYLKRRRT
jgi:predicted DNA-binding transcriptional regulator AlpA